jgi:hypothetical protein
MSFSGQLERPQPTNRMWQFLLQHNPKKMFDLDKAEESRLAIKHRHRKQVASRLEKWRGKKLAK